MATDSRDNFGEYGGKPGLIQKAEDGHVELTVKEKAMVGRIYGKDGSQGAQVNEVAGGVDAVTGEVWEDASHRRMVLDREAAQAKLNGRGIEEV
jgi:hypothetical protein